MKNIFVFLLSLVFFVSLISATSFSVGFNVYNGTIAGTKLINGTSPVLDFYVNGYTCLDLTCTHINSTAFSFSNHSSSNQINLFFPNQSKYGYVLYFYKDGYIGNEMKGNAGNPNVAVYLSRKINGTAQIKNVQGINTNISNGTILNLNYNVDSSDAILDNRSADYPLQESVNVRSWMIIKNSTNNLVYNKIELNPLNYSGSFSKSFNYQFNNSGIYNITIVSEINDSKILHPTNSTFSFLTNVYLNLSNNSSQNNTNNQTNNTNPDNQTNQSFQYSYSNLSNIIFSSNISINQTIPFSFNYSDVYYNGSDNFSRDGNLTVSIFNFTNLFSKFYFVLNRTSTNYTWNYNFVNPGNYTINFYLCPIIETVGENYSCASRNISFYVQGLSNQNSTNNSTNNSTSNSDNSCHTYKRSKSIIYLDDNQNQISNPVVIDDDLHNNTIVLSFKKEAPKNFAELVYDWIIFILILSMLLILLILVFISKKHL